MHGFQSAGLPHVLKHWIDQPYFDHMEWIESRGVQCNGIRSGSLVDSPSLVAVMAVALSSDSELSTQTQSQKMVYTNACLITG
jgi:hypothetical protein